jgi:hypothetical protein
MDECLVNAQRHGAATRMTVSVVTDDDRLTLMCLDNGREGSSSDQVGLGSDIFDEVALRHDGSWELSRQDGGAKFSMNVATG